jgi:hypothetical protein
VLKRADVLLDFAESIVLVVQFVFQRENIDPFESRVYFKRRVQHQTEFALVDRRDRWEKIQKQFLEIILDLQKKGKKHGNRALEVHRVNKNALAGFPHKFFDVTLDKCRYAFLVWIIGGLNIFFEQIY